VCLFVGLCETNYVPGKRATEMANKEVCNSFDALAQQCVGEILLLLPPTIAPSDRDVILEDFHRERIGLLRGHLSLC
jgi:hypothetical protein